MSPEVIIGLAIAISAPLTMAAFKLLPDRKSQDRNMPDHDHNSKYLTRGEFLLHQQNTELLAHSLQQCTETLAINLASDIADIKQKLNILDTWIRGNPKHENTH